MDALAFLQFEADLSSADVITAYDELPLWSAMFGLLLLDKVPLSGVDVALDVGCGTGFPLIELAERLGPHAHVHGVDVWSSALERAAEKVESRRTTVLVERAGRMRFASGTALFNHHFIKLGFLDGWKQVVSGRETETFQRLQRRLDEIARHAGQLSLTNPMASVDGVAV